MRDSVKAVMSTFTTPQLRRIANSSSTAGRFSWAEIAYADELLRERAA